MNHIQKIYKLKNSIKKLNNVVNKLIDEFELVEHTLIKSNCCKVRINGWEQISLAVDVWPVDNNAPEPIVEVMAQFINPIIIDEDYYIDELECRRYFTFEELFEEIRNNLR